MCACNNVCVFFIVAFDGTTPTITTAATVAGVQKCEHLDDKENGTPSSSSLSSS